MIVGGNAKIHHWILNVGIIWYLLLLFCYATFCRIRIDENAILLYGYYNQNGENKNEDR